jgi:hypothetical protein
MSVDAAMTVFIAVLGAVIVVGLWLDKDGE